MQHQKSTAHLSVPKISETQLKLADQAVRFKHNTVVLKITPGISKYVCVRFYTHTKDAIIPTPLNVLFMDSETTEYRSFAKQLNILLDQAWRELTVEAEAETKRNSRPHHTLQTKVWDETTKKLFSKFRYHETHTNRSGMGERKLKIVSGNNVVANSGGHSHEQQ